MHVHVGKIYSVQKFAQKCPFVVGIQYMYCINLACFMLQRTKMKQPHRFTIGQFNKDTPLEDILNEPLVISHGILDTPTVMRSASETTFDNQDSCLADDEVTFHSTQHDSDSSALFMLPGEDGRQLDNLTIEAVTNGEKKLEPLNDLVEDVSVGVVMDGNQNISDSVVAMYEATCNADKQNNPQGKDISPKDTPLQSPQANTGTVHVNVIYVKLIMYYNYYHIPYSDCIFAKVKKRENLTECNFHNSCILYCACSVFAKIKLRKN